MREFNEKIPNDIISYFNKELAYISDSIQNFRKGIQEKEEFKANRDKFDRILNFLDKQIQNSVAVGEKAYEKSKPNAILIDDCGYQRTTVANFFDSRDIYILCLKSENEIPQNMVLSSIPIFIDLLLGDVMKGWDIAYDLANNRKAKNIFITTGEDGPSIPDQCQSIIHGVLGKSAQELFKAYQDHHSSGEVRENELN